MNINPRAIALDEITLALVDFGMLLFLQSGMPGKDVTFGNDYFLHFLPDLAIIQRAKVMTGLQWMLRKMRHRFVYRTKILQLLDLIVSLSLCQILRLIDKAY